jgi:hypothetical protein
VRSQALAGARIGSGADQAIEGEQHAGLRELLS